MSTVDQFASVFNAASQTAFQHKPPALENALVVTDLGSEAAEKFTDNARTFFGGVTGTWCSIHGGEFATVKELLNLVESRKPGFIVTYRHLHSEAWRWPYSLGEHLDVLIQESAPPVAILPHPDREGAPEHTLKNTDSVMVINSHLVQLALATGYLFGAEKVGLIKKLDPNKTPITAKTGDHNGTDDGH